MGDMDDDDAFASLVAAMNEEQVNGEEDVSGNTSRNDSTATSTPCTPDQTAEPENVSVMMLRIKQLEEELARAKRTITPGVSANSALASPVAVMAPKKPMLKDLNYNIFMKKPDAASLVSAPTSTAKSAQKLTLADIGLSESSGEDDEYSNPSNLSKAGRDLKRKLSLREREENSAKKSRTDASFTSSSQSNDKSSAFATLCVPASSIEPQRDQTSSRLSNKAKVVEQCCISGIRIANPFINTASVKSTIGDRWYCKLSQLPRLRSQINNQTDWVTIGVVVQKLPVKQAANGASFSIWKLSDMEDTVHLTTLFLFAEAHKESSNIPIRTVIAITKASLMPKKEGKDELAISVNQGNRLLELGFSDDFGVCIGRTKAGAPCGNLVNAARAEYCVYHLHGALQKTSSNRMELQSNFSGVQPKTSKVKEVANGYFYGGKLYTSPLAPKASKTPAKDYHGGNVPSKPAVPISKEAQALINEARTLVKSQMNEQEQRTLDSMTAKNAQLNQLVVIDGPGARNLVRSATKLGQKSQPAAYVTPGQLLRDHRAAMGKLVADQNKRVAEKDQSQGATAGKPSTSALPRKCAKLSVSPAARVAPMFARGSRPGAVVSLDDDEEEGGTAVHTHKPSLAGSNTAAQPPTKGSSNLTPSRRRALAKLQMSGKTVQKNDPNKMANGLSARARERIEAMDFARKPAELDTVPVKAPVCNLRDDPELQALMNECSQHEDLVKLHEIDHMDGYFKRAAAKEGLEEVIESTKEVECAVVTCRQCRYTASSLSELCFKEKHDHVKHKATRRFFQCRKCSKRKPSFNSIMPSPCKACGTQNFERCGMLAYERKGPKLDSEILLVRGEETGKFLNSPQ